MSARRLRPCWPVPAVVLLSLGAACGSSQGAARATPSAVAPVAAALGGTGSMTGNWFHLEGGRYRITWKSDHGEALSGTCLVRQSLVAGTPTSVDQTTPVAFLGRPGEDVETLAAGDYFINVAVLTGSSVDWTVDITKIG
jgi:hypothetical protein